MPDVAEGPWLSSYGREKAKDLKGKNLGLGFFFCVTSKLAKLPLPHV